MNIFVSDLIGLKTINKYVKSSKQKARARGGRNALNTLTRAKK